MMKALIPYKRGRYVPPPLIAATAAVFLLFIYARFAPAVEPVPNSSSGRYQTDRITLTVDQAINMTLTGNREIANSRYTVESQRYSVESADSLFDLKLIPSGSATMNGGNYSDYEYFSTGVQLQKKFTHGTTVSVGPQVTRSSRQSSVGYTTDIGVTVTQPLMRGLGRDVATDSLQTADAAYRTSLRNLYQTKVNRVLEAISAYYDAVRQGELLNLYENMRSRLEGHSEIARAKEKVGLATPMDTYRVEMLLSDTEDSIITASQLLRTSRDSLKLILGVSQKTDLDLEFPDSPDIAEKTLDEAVETALENRIEMEQVSQDLSEAERKASVKKNDILPDLNLVIKYGRYDTAYTLEESTGLDRDRYSVGLNISSDIGRAEERAAYQQSLINIKKLAIDAENREEDIRSQVRTQWLSLQEAVKRIEVRKAQIRQGEEKLALAEVKFAHDMADNFDIIEAEKELQNARGNLLAAEIDYALGTYNLRAVLGMLVPRD